MPRCCFASASASYSWPTASCSKCSPSRSLEPSRIFFAYLVIAGEIGGGLALILGLWTRPISLLLLPIMIGATLQHVGGGWLFTNQGGGWEFPVFWTAALVVQALLGDGAFALRTSRNSDPVGKLAGAHPR
jgi:uncharacterized membrane protein YphA (DoxX/SURF4 family)